MANSIKSEKHSNHVPKFLSSSINKIIWCSTQLMLHGNVILLFYWFIKFDTGINWRQNRRQMLNMHSFLTTTSTVYLNGQAILMLKSNATRTVSRTVHKYLITLSTVLMIVGFIIGIQAQDMFHKGRDGIHFYSIHGWIGLVNVGLLILHMLFGWVYMGGCKGSGADYKIRALHRTVGLIVFSLSVATSLVGISQTSRARLSGPTESDPNKPDYKVQTGNPFLNPGMVINMAGICLMGSGILVPLIVRNN